MFLELKGGQESRIQNLLSTHPLDTHRIHSIDEYVQTEHAPLPAKLVVNTPRFDQFLTQIKSAQHHYEGFDKAVALIAKAQEEGDPGLLDQAQTLLLSGERALPEHALFPMALGVLALERDDLGSAANSLDRAVSLDSELFSARLYRGVLYRRRGQQSEAVAELSTAHELHNPHPLPCYLLGSLSEDSGNVDAAVSWYEKTIERSPEGSDLRTDARSRLDVLVGGPG